MTYDNPCSPSVNNLIIITKKTKLTTIYKKIVFFEYFKNMRTKLNKFQPSMYLNLNII